METYFWYKELIKPSWAPPAWVFGPTWIILYAIIGITFGFVFYKIITKELPWKIAIPFILNLIFNFIFPSIQFTLQNNFLAAADIILVLATLIWAMIAIYPHIKLIAYANIPYLLWVVFATILQFTVTYLNP